MLGLALDYRRFLARSGAQTVFRALSHEDCRRWSADPTVGEGYYHVQWIAQPDQGPFAGETWLIGDQPWADAPEFMVWGLDCKGWFGASRFSWMFQNWPSAWSRKGEPG